MILDRLVADASRARARGNDLLSTREGYALLLASRDDLWREIKANNDILASHEAEWLVLVVLRFLSEIFEIPIDVVATQIAVELARARSAFPPFSCAHHGYAVVLEELDELWDVIKAAPENPGDLRKQIIDEAIQVGAMGVRLLADVWGIE